MISANVINNTSQEATITNEDGEFEIKVKLNEKAIGGKTIIAIK